MLHRIPVLNKWLDKGAAETPPPPPLTAMERARLEHRRRKLQRDLRRVDKRGGITCGGCAKEPPSRGSLRASKLVDAMRAELKAIEWRLDEG